MPKDLFNCPRCGVMYPARLCGVTAAVGTSSTVTCKVCGKPFEVYVEKRWFGLRKYIGTFPR